MIFFNRIFKITFLFIVFAELLSLCGYLLPDFNMIAFFVIVLLTLVLSLQKLEYGVWIVLAELFIGSKGYLFFFEYDGLVLSIRIALWLVVMAVWLGKAVSGRMKKYKKQRTELSSKSFYGLEFFKSQYSKYFLVLFIFIAWGVVNGILSHNEFSNIFFDFNGWLYFTLVFPVYYILKIPQPPLSRGLKSPNPQYPLGDSNPPTPLSKGGSADPLLSEAGLRESPPSKGGRGGLFAGGSHSVLQIFTAAIIWLSVKTFFLLFIFSHNMNSIVSEVYRWTRVSGVGEITQMQGGFYRIFFQSHIFVLIGFFIFLIIAINQITNKTEKSPNPLYQGGIKEKSPQLLFNKGGNNKELLSVNIHGRAIKLLSAICYLLSVILITFSRSFWVGLAFGIILFYAYLFWQKIGWKKLLKITGALIACGAISIALIAAIVKFPYPSPTGGFSTSELLSERASKVKGESALSSRWALLPKLLDEIKKNPILGQGFGAVVTYQSSDPRVLETSPTGEYTTYAFEWGWLDIWLKSGLFGMLAYLFLLGKIIFSGLKLGVGNWESECLEHKIILGLTLGLAVISVVSVFSPYMNHPLGIGYLILVSAILENFKAKKEGSARDP